MTTATIVHERRKFTRQLTSQHLGVHVLASQRALPVNSLNVSAGGLCVRLEEMLEVRSTVRVQLTGDRTAAPGSRPLECDGRVAWVVQRLDLRSAPPFLFDVGIELVNPQSAVRQLLRSSIGGQWAARRASTPRERALEPVTITGRHYVPRLTHELQQAQRWHLIVSADGAPCFSGRYASERAALAAWAGFTRRQLKKS